MIEAHQLCKRFGTFQAVRDVSLDIQPGEVLALLGPNGAGKTTTVRMLGAILKPTSGWARISGHDVVAEARVVRSKIGLLTEYPGLYSRMYALEYLHFFGSLLGLNAQQSQQRADLLLKRFDLWEARDKRLDSYSKGMKQKIALVRALIHDPPVLFLDEPTTAMDPQSARTVRDAIGDLRAADRSILLTTHNLTEAEVLADRIAIIRGGQIIVEGTIAQITQTLMGDPLWELRLARVQDQSRIKALIGDLVTIETVSAEAVRYRCPDPRQINPQILARLFAQDIALVSIAEVPRSLEDVYLSIVSDPTKATERSDAATYDTSDPGYTTRHAVLPAPARQEEIVS